MKCGSSEQWLCPGEPTWPWPPASPHLSQNSASQLWPTPCCADADESLYTFLFFTAFGFALIWFACRNDIKRTATSTARSPSAGSSMSHSKVNSERTQNATADERASSFELCPNTCSCEECSSHSQPMQHASNESLVPPSVLQGDLSQNILTELDVELTGLSVRGHVNRRGVMELQQSAVPSKKEGVTGELRLDHVALITSDKSSHEGVVEVQGGCSTTDISRTNEEETFTKSSGRVQRRSSNGVLSSARKFIVPNTYGFGGVEGNAKTALSSDEDVEVPHRVAPGASSKKSGAVFQFAHQWLGGKKISKSDVVRRRGL